MTRHKLSPTTALDLWELPEGSGVARVSKWGWLWRQFLCLLGISKRPYMIVGIDTSTGEDFSVQAWVTVDNDGKFLISHIAEYQPNRTKSSDV